MCVHCRFTVVDCSAAMNNDAGKMSGCDTPKFVGPFSAEESEQT